MCYTNGWDQFIPVIILTTFSFTSSVLFETHILSDSLSIVLQPPSSLSH